MLVRVSICGRRRRCVCVCVVCVCVCRYTHHLWGDRGPGHLQPTLFVPTLVQYPADISVYMSSYKIVYRCIYIYRLICDTSICVCACMSSTTSVCTDSGAMSRRYKCVDVYVYNMCIDYYTYTH